MKLFTTLIATAVSVAAVAICAPAHALVFTQWNFNNSDLTPNINLTGNGTASLVGGTTTTFAGGAGSTDPSTPTNIAWNTATYPGQNIGNKTAGVQFATSTAGYQNIIVSWDQRNSGTASKYGQFQYSTDGNTFVDFGGPSITGANGSFLSYSVDLSSITAVNNNSNFAFRLVSAFDPTTGNTSYTGTGGGYTTTGTWRFDMVTANGNAVAVPFDTPGGATIPTVGSLVVLGAMIKVRKTIASKIANPVTSAVS